MTRTKNKIHIPGSLLPVDFTPSPNIVILEEKSKPELENTKPRPALKKQPYNLPPSKAYAYDNIRKEHAGAYAPWTPEQDKELIAMCYDGLPVRMMANHFGRTQGAIRSRIKKLELKDL